MTKVEIFEQIAKVAQKLAIALDSEALYDKKVKQAELENSVVLQRCKSYKQEYTDQAAKLQSEFDRLILQLKTTK